MRLTSRVAKALSGKTAIVTASTDGIGFAIAKRLAQDGAKVWISSRKQDNVDAALEELRGMDLDVDGMVCHVGDKDHRHELIETVMEKDKALNILVSNAAVNPFFGSILDTPEASWDKIFDINVKNAFQLIQECVPYLSQNETSNITTIASIAGYQPMPMLGAYSVSKTALISLSKVLAMELADEGIRVNTVCPGVVKTKFAGAIVEMEDQVAQQFALKRFAVPDEMSGIVAFLSDDERASYITGESYTVSGGGNFRI